MQILKYESEQFAGVRNQKISFDKGMNVILGNNETGKSTMITGIYETLLRPSKIKLNSNAGKIFKDQSFPTSGGNSIDGSVQLAIEDGKVTIEKKWDQDKTDFGTTFRNASGEKYTGEKAEEEIRKLLNYGEAIYNHIVFGRQNNETAILDWFYSFIDTKKIQGDGIAEARKRISEALSAAGGISEDLYLQKLEEKINALKNHWNISLNAPEKGRGINNRWDKKVSGEILEAYYALEECKQIFDHEKKLVHSVINDKRELQEKKKQKIDLEEQQKELNLSKSVVVEKALYSKSKKECIQNLHRLKNAEQIWPQLEKDKVNIETLSAEQEEQQNRIQKQELEKKVIKLYTLEKQQTEIQTNMDGKEFIEEDTRICQKLLDEIDGTKLKLGSAKLHAQITMLSDCAAQMVTADGETIQINQQYDAPVNGFAKIQIPGIAEILVTPQKLDVVGQQKLIEEKQQKIQKIFKKYEVPDQAVLSQKCETYRENKSSLFNLNQEIQKILDKKTKEALEEEVQNIQINEMVSIRENLIDDVQTVLSKYGAKTLDGCMTVVRAQIEACEKDYDSVVKLKEMIAEEEEKLNEAEKSLKKLETVSWTKEDFDMEMERIQRELKGKDGNSGLDQEIEALIVKIGNKNRDIDNINLDVREQEKENLEKNFEQKKKLYHQYSKIKNDFNSLKEKQGSKNDAFYSQFNKYLSIITGNQVQIENGKVKSDKNELNNKELLSRGTKQTILLAFRLALLEYYYHDNGGVMILDDVLLDMDQERRKQSVKLLQKFAEKNQVIFTTCDPMIADMLGGNRIELEKNL